MRRAQGTVATLALACSLVAIAAPAASAAGDAPQPKIVNGSQVSIDDHPWQVFLAIFRDNLEFDCGGSIRDATHVVTAAHCVVDDSGDYPEIAAPGDLSVGYGSANIGSLTWADVGAVTVDPRYKRDLGSQAYDDAVLTLTAPIAFGSNGTAPQPIAYASSQELDAFFDDGGFVTGWGTLSEGGDTPPDQNLRGASIPLQPDGQCDFEYGDFYVPAVMICAGGSGTDTCQGDSGGPLTIVTDPGPPVVRKLVGITSGGHGCGRLNVPGYYTWVQSPEILQVIANPTPPAAPGGPPAANPGVTGVLRVGRAVTCNAPALAGAVAKQYLWYRYTKANGYVAIAHGRTITLPPAALGSTIECDVRYEGAGGFVYKESSAAGFVGPVRAAAFLSNTKVTLSLPSARIPASGPLPVRVTNANNFQVTGRLSGRSVDRLPSGSREKRVAIASKSFTAKPQRKPIVKLALPDAIRSALKRTGSVKLALTAVVRDPSGHSRTVGLTATVKKKG